MKNNDKNHNKNTFKKQIENDETNIKQSIQVVKKSPEKNFKMK